MAARKNPGFNRHPVENVKLGLRVLAKVGGDAGRAAMILARDETIAHPPGRQTLNRWKIRYAQPYHQLFEEERASVDNWAADRAREIAIKAQAGSEQLVDRTIERIDEIEPKDLAPRYQRSKSRRAGCWRRSQPRSPKCATRTRSSRS
jgi:hypothetical protein